MTNALIRESPVILTLFPYGGIYMDIYTRSKGVKLEYDAVGSGFPINDYRYEIEETNNRE